MKLLLIIASCFLSVLTSGQSNTYLADLAALKSVIQKTPSYKSQIKGERKAQYNALYNYLQSDTVNDVASYEYFYNLSQLIFPLQDNHLGFYQLPNYTPFKTKESIDSFVKTSTFLRYPTLGIDLDSLQRALAGQPADSLEGIYHYGRLYTVGLSKREENQYVGVVLHSTVNFWQRGQVAIHLYQFAPQLYKAIYGHPLTKNYILLPIEKYQNQSLANSHFYGPYIQNLYTKVAERKDHVNLPQGGAKFALRNINDTVQYLLVQTFQRNHKTTAASQQFYDSIKGLLKAPYLILDLRNNEGGAKKEMSKYLKLLRSYVKKGQLYVVMNNGTLSQAEKLCLKLKKLQNVTTVGQRTKGMLAYGSNWGKTITLPSGQFAIYPTDMKFGSSLLKYENVGIEPQLFLKNDRAWIEQVIEMITNKPKQR